MRFLYSLLLSVCCLAATLQSNATESAVKKAATTNEYRAAEQAIPNNNLTDYYQIISTGNAVTNHSAAKESSDYFAGNVDRNTKSYILNDNIESAHLFFSGSYAKTFRIKLIFPQHYHW